MSTAPTRYDRLRAIAAHGDFEDAFAHLSALDIMRICAWRLLEQGKWKEAGDIAARLSPFEHARQPQFLTVQHDPEPPRPAAHHALADPRAEHAPLAPLLPLDPAARPSRRPHLRRRPLTPGQIAHRERVEAERARNAAIRATMDAHLETLRLRRETARAPTPANPTAPKPPVADPPAATTPDTP